jgi:serine/threonine protein kinase
MIKRLNDMGNVTETIVEHFTEGKYCQVKEPIVGTSLEEWLPSHLNFEDRKRLAIVTSGIIKHIHKNGIVHQDLKPEQIMVIDDPSSGMGFKIILTDFDWSIPDGNIIRVVGTPWYNSPESITGKRITEKSDIFTLGIMLFEFFTGVNPYSHHDVFITPELWRDFVLNKKYRQAIDYNPEDVNKDINDIIINCLDPNPESRPSIDEIQMALIGKKTPPPGKKTPPKTPEIIECKSVVIQHGSSNRTIVPPKDLGRSEFKTFFGTINDDEGNPIYRYLESELPLLRFAKADGGITICSPSPMKNYFTLNGAKITSSPMAIKSGDKLGIFSVSKSKNIVTFDIN